LFCESHHLFPEVPDNKEYKKANFKDLFVKISQVKLLSNIENQTQSLTDNAIKTQQQNEGRSLRFS